ncbi:putative reverse transcriptase domain-containing protein [Tanacetum coccineum]
MAELRETDRRRKGQMVEILRVMRDMRREMGDMQAELLALREQRRRARQPGPDVRVPDHQDASRGADSHIYWNSHSSYRDNRRNVQTARPCFYADFMKCQPLNFKGTEGVVGLTRCCFDLVEWSDKNLRSRCIFNDLGSTQEEDDRQSSRPSRWNENIELANELDGSETPHLRGERKAVLTTKETDSSRNNHGHQQQPFKRQNVAKVYNMETSEKKSYGGSLPKSSGNTNGANTQKGNGENPKGNGCFECGAPGHFKRDCLKLKNKDGGNGNA